MWAQDIGQGAQLYLNSPVGQLVLAHPSSGQGSGVRQGGEKFIIFNLVMELSISILLLLCISWLTRMADFHFYISNIYILFTLY